MIRRAHALGALVVVIAYLPLIALAVLAAVLGGVRVVIALVMLVGLFAFLYRRARRPQVPASRLRGVAEFVGFTLIGGVIGGIAFGALGVIFGLALGFTLRLAEVPITKRT